MGAQDGSTTSWGSGPLQRTTPGEEQALEWTTKTRCRISIASGTLLLAARFTHVRVRP
jgi:hypothetical protein